MYNPCFDCLIRYERKYSKECVEICEYANFVNKINELGGMDEITRVMNGDSFPLVFIDEKHIDFTHRLVCEAKEKNYIINKGA